MNWPRVLIVDLNNFARYPTIAVGYLTSVLRAAECDVHVLSPLFHGVPGVEREPKESALRGAARRINYRLHHRTDLPTAVLHRTVDWARRRWSGRSRNRIVEAFEAADPSGFDVVLVSTYLMYHDVCAEIGERCRELDVPLLIGGSYFADAEVVQAWLELPGLTALVGGEVELELPELIATAARREDLTRFDGVWVPGGVGRARPPLRELDRVPFPDYRDFPWSLYPNRIVPMITGRGCGWGSCAFCSDVTSTAGRTYRSRSPENVMDEIEFQSRRHETARFVFTDLKLNSNLEVWEALIGGIRARAAGATWVGAVHVGARSPNGLDRKTLEAAKRAGLARLTTGLESGSQRVLDAMHKGSELSVTSRFLRDAAEVGISMRVTMIHGYPGEQAQDVLESARFLEEHFESLDRVQLNRFQVMMGPTFLRRFDADPKRFPEVRAGKRHPRTAVVSHDYEAARNSEYAGATRRLLFAVHRINRKALHDRAAEFEGVM